VFPSHGPVFDHYLDRIEELERHHDQRLALIGGIVKSRGGAHAYDVCRELFGANLSIHNLRFALSETLAHLEYLRLRGKLEAEEREGVIVYIHR
jgi:hypothetical protein